MLGSKRSASASEVDWRRSGESRVPTTSGSAGDRRARGFLPRPCVRASGARLCKPARTGDERTLGAARTEPAVAGGSRARLELRLSHLRHLELDPRRRWSGGFLRRPCVPSRTADERAFGAPGTEPVVAGDRAHLEHRLSHLRYRGLATSRSLSQDPGSDRARPRKLLRALRQRHRRRQLGHLPALALRSRSRLDGVPLAAVATRATGNGRGSIRGGLGNHDPRRDRLFDRRGRGPLGPRCAQLAVCAHSPVAYGLGVSAEGLWCHYS